MTTAHSRHQNLEHLSAPQLRRLVAEMRAEKKLGLYWEADAIERDQALNADVVLPLQAQPWFRNATCVLSQKASNDAVNCMSLARLDATFEFNRQELAFAKALDRADFVAWWHRNPQGKPCSLALMRSDSRHLFYPDFIVCLQHDIDAEPLLRLIETRHGVKDAKRKARHASRSYGKTLFLTQDAERFKIVEDDGSLGDVVDPDDLSRLRQWMRDTQPQF